METWELEKERLAKDGRSPFTIYNKLILWNLICIAYLILLWTFIGKKAFLFHIVYSISGVLLFEGVNYIEHYGLERKKDANGNYESINIKHSWNAPQAATNYFFFIFQRHSDHHANAYKPYQILESHPESPMLPNSYIVCLALCFYPPLWNKVMNPYVDAANNNEKLPQIVKD